MIILPGICSPPSLISMTFPEEDHWVHHWPQLTGKQELCWEPWFLLDAPAHLPAPDSAP